MCVYVCVCVWGAVVVQKIQEETETERDRDIERQRHVYLSSIVLIYQFNNIYHLVQS